MNATDELSGCIIDLLLKEPFYGGVIQNTGFMRPDGAEAASPRSPATTHWPGRCGVRAWG